MTKGGVWIRALVEVTTDAVDRRPGVVVRYEALIVVMHAMIRGIMARFGERGRSLCDHYCSEMVPYLVAAGLPADRLEEHVPRRFVEYDKILAEFARPESVAGPWVGALFAAYITDSTPEEANDEAIFSWLSWYRAVCEAFDKEIIPQVAPGVLTRLWQSVQWILRGI